MWDVSPVYELILQKKLLRDSVLETMNYSHEL
jgi:hypothetical protein